MGLGEIKVNETHGRLPSLRASLGFIFAASEWCCGDIMHKKNSKKLQARKIRGIIFHNSFYDRSLGESVSRITRLEVLGQLKEPVEVHLVPDVEKGEVLLDLRGRGSFQKIGV